MWKFTAENAEHDMWMAADVFGSKCQKMEFEPPNLSENCGSEPSKIGCCIRNMGDLTGRVTAPKSDLTANIFWLVVWNVPQPSLHADRKRGGLEHFLFSIIYGIIIPTD